MTTEALHATGDERLRIAMVAACPFPANHGTPAAIRELSLALADQGHEVHVVTYPLGEDLPTGGLRIHRANVPALLRSNEIRIGPSLDRCFYDVAMVWKLVSVVRRHDIQVMNSHNYEATIIATIAKWLTRRPMIYTGVNSMADELMTYSSVVPKGLARRVGRLLDTFVPRGADFATVLTEDLDVYLQSLGLPREKLLVIPPGVDTAMFEHGDGARVRRRYGLAPDVPLVIYTGALESFQRVDLIFDAMPAVLVEHPDAVLMMAVNIENPVLRGQHMERASKLGIADHVIFTPPVALSELPDHLAAADVGVVPRPACPGFPIKLLNYMAAGKAIVCAEGGAKALCHGYNGYVARDNDPQDLARGISKLLGDARLRSILGGRARDSVRELHDWGMIARGTAMLYRRVLENRREPCLDDLGGFIKGSYVPRLHGSSTCVAEGDDFLQTGPIEYPELRPRTGRHR